MASKDEHKDGEAFLRIFPGKLPFELKPIEFDDVPQPKFKFAVAIEPAPAPAEKSS